MQETLERIVETVVEEHPVKTLSVRPLFYFHVEQEVLSTVFTKTADIVTLHSAYMPTEERLVQWAERLRALNSNLECFQLEMRYTGYMDDIHDNKHFFHRGSMLHFEYAKDGEFIEPICDESHKHSTTIRPIPDAARSDDMNREGARCRYVVCPGYVQRCYEMVVVGARDDGIID
jgi:hypothetical protein